MSSAVRFTKEQIAAPLAETFAAIKDQPATVELFSQFADGVLDALNKALNRIRELEFQVRDVVMRKEIGAETRALQATDFEERLALLEKHALKYQGVWSPVLPYERGHAVTLQGAL
jgi:hypothetical protein